MRTTFLPLAVSVLIPSSVAYARKPDQVIEMQGSAIVLTHRTKGALCSLPAGAYSESAKRNGFMQAALAWIGVGVGAGKQDGKSYGFEFSEEASENMATLFVACVAAHSGVSAEKVREFRDILTGSPAKEARDLRFKLEAVYKTNDMLLARIDGLEAEKKADMGKIIELDKKVAVQEQLIEFLQTRNKDLEHANAVQAERIGELRDALASERSEVEALKAEKAELQLVYAQVKAENERLKAENERLKTENEQLKAENEQLRAGR